MDVSLGAKRDIYTGDRCLTGGILLGRISSGLTRFGRALEDTTSWSPIYGVSKAARPAYDAAIMLEKIFPKARPEVKTLQSKVQRYKEYSSGFDYLDREKAAQDLAEAKKLVATISQIAVKDCGRRRPEEGEGAALLQMKRIKRVPRPPKPAQEIMDVPAQVPEPKEGPGMTMGIIAGVLGLIGVTILLGRA